MTVAEQRTLGRAGSGGRSYQKTGVEYQPGVSGTIGQPVARTESLPINPGNTLWPEMSFEEAMTQANSSFADNVDVPQYETNTGATPFNINEKLGRNYWLALLNAETVIPAIDGTAVGSVVSANGVSDIPITLPGLLPGLGVLVNWGGVLEEPSIVHSYTAGHLLVNELDTNKSASNVTVKQPEFTLYAHSLLPSGYEDDMVRLSVERIIGGRWGKLFPGVVIEKAELTLGKGIGKVSMTPYGTLESIDMDPKLAAPAAGAMTATPGGAGNVDVGAHDVFVTFTDAHGETTGSGHVTAVVATSAKTVAVANIPVGPEGTVSRKVYATKANTITPGYFVVEIANNTATTATYNVADTALTVLAPVANSTGNITPYDPSAGDEAAALSPMSAIAMMLAAGGDPEGTGTSSFRAAFAVKDCKITYDNALIKESVLGNATMQAFDGDKKVCTVSLTVNETARRTDIWNDYIKADVGTAFIAGYFKNRGTKSAPNNQMVIVYVPFGKWRNPKLKDDPNATVEFTHAIKGIRQRGNYEDLMRVAITN